MPLLSICIPTYNRADCLLETLKSITENEIFQNTDDIEIVISNNASTDDTDEICQKFKEKFPEKINYIKLETPIYSDANIFGVSNYARGKYCKLNNDTCIWRQNSFEKITDYLKNNDDDFIFFLNQDINPSYRQKTLTYSEFLNLTSYEITWVGGMCFKKEVYQKIENPLRYKEKRLVQIDLYGKVFSLGHSITVWREKLFDIVSPPKKGGEYNIAEVFGKNYFDILSEYKNRKNGTTDKIINREKKKILNFINRQYFDFNNKYSFKKTGYFRYMFKYYKFKPYFYIKYFIILMRKIISPLFRIEKKQGDKKIIIFNSIEL